MKKSVWILLGLLTGLAGCSSQKKLEKSPPFVISSATFEPWVSGKDESGLGHTVKINLSQMAAGDVALQNIYFQGQMSRVILDMDDQGMVATAKFESLKPDMIMHGDPTREVGNQPPKIRKGRKDTFPFELKDDEAILSYLQNDKVKYVKIPGVISKPVGTYPGRPQN